MRSALCIVVCVVALAGAAGPSRAGDVKVRYLYNLSDLDGPVGFTGGRVRVDPAHDETLVLEDNTVHVYNAAAMEVYSFAADIGAGYAFDVAVEDGGDVLLAFTTYRPGMPAEFFVQRCDYRGRPKALVMPELPDDLAGFSPSSMLLREGRLLFLSAMQLRLVVLGTDGAFVRQVDLAPLLDVDEDERGSLEIGGFGFDAQGNALFTVPELHTVAVVGPDWKRRGGFGRRGSGPGRLAVPAGVVGDELGNLYVADKGRSVVLVFDANHRFVTEFGGYGDRPQDLVRPDQVACAPGGRLYVNQKRDRGVSVFDVAAQ